MGLGVYGNLSFELGRAWYNQDSLLKRQPEDEKATA
jgi:hypothetical protein